MFDGYDAAGWVNEYSVGNGLDVEEQCEFVHALSVGVDIDDVN